MTARIKALFACGVLTFAVVVALPTAAFAAEAPADETEEVEVEHSAEECIHILEDGGTIDDCQEAPNPILPETNEIIWGSISFVVLFVLLWKKGLPPIRKAMQAREDKIRHDLESAETARVEAEAEGARYRAQLGDARTEANQIVEEARQAAEQVRRDLIARAEADAADIRARAQDDIQLARDRTMSDIQRQVADLSIDLAERVVERSLDRETQLALIESYINSVGNGQQ